MGRLRRSERGRREVIAKLASYAAMLSDVSRFGAPAGGWCNRSQFKTPGATPIVLAFGPLAGLSVGDLRSVAGSPGPSQRGTTMSKAWVYQDDKQVKKVGKKQASWYVGWLDPEGKRRCKSFGRGSDGKRLADHFKRKVEAELMTGTYQSTNRKTW